MLKVPIYQLYLLQLENYELGRYFKLLYKKGSLPPKVPLRKGLVWTGKALVIFLASEFLIFALAGYVAWALQRSVLENWAACFVAGAGLVVGFNFLSFIFFVAVTVLFKPADFLFKQWIILRAKAKVRDLPNLKIIGIAGSFGKTTMKQVLSAVLSSKYKVLSTPESVNTPVGISRWVIKKFSADLEIAIVEMGEHYKGDVEEICKIVRPDIAVITGIDEAHLERMKKMEAVTATIFEIVSTAKPGAKIFLNAESERVMGHYKEYVWPDMKVITYQKPAAAKRDSQVGADFNPERLFWDFSMEGGESVKLRLLGEYALANAECAVKLGRLLGLSDAEIKNGLERIHPVNHRLEPSISPGNILVIDDAYNGNSEGAYEAIKVLSRFKNRRKIYITPGLVETGAAAKDVHMEIGRRLAGVADVVILIRNSVTGWIEEGILSVIARNASDEAIFSAGRLPRPSDALGARNDKLKIIWFETAQEAHSSLSKILKPNDVILFQNDWGDQYV